MIQISEVVRRNFGRRVIAVSAAATLACVTLVTGCGESTPQPVGQVKSHSSDAAPVSPTGQPVAVIAKDSSAATQEAPVQWTDFPFMTSADAVVSVIQPAALAESPALKKLFSALPAGKVNLPIPPAETEWVAIYATPLVDDDGGLTGDTTMVLKLNRPSSVYEIAESRFDTDQLEDVEVNGRSYLRVSGLSQETIEVTTDADGNASEILNLNVAPQMAVYEHDEFTFVVCEEGRLPFVLDRSEIESPLRTLVGNADSDSPIFVAASFQDRPMLSDALKNQASSLGDGSLFQTLAANTESVILIGDFEGKDLLTLSLTAAGTEQADSIEKSVQASAKGAAEFLQQMQAFAAPETKMLFETGQNLVQVSVSRNGNTIDVAMTNSGDLPVFFSSLAAMFGQRLAAK